MADRLLVWGFQGCGERRRGRVLLWPRHEKAEIWEGLANGVLGLAVVAALFLCVPQFAKFGRESGSGEAMGIMRGLDPMTGPVLTNEVVGKRQEPGEPRAGVPLGETSNRTSG